MFRVGTFLIILISAAQVWGFRPYTDDTSTLNECLWNKQNFVGQVECSDLFQHYLPRSYRYRPNKNLRLGAYNILRISSEKGKKNIRANAAMINDQWDLLALSELQPGRTEDIQKSFSDSRYILPEYILLLEELQKLDPSWGMILSPFSQGSDAEVFGFLYRRDEVMPVESNYCEKNYIDNKPYSSSFVYRELNESGIESSQDGRPINKRKYVTPKKALACPLAVRGVRSKFMTKIPLTARFKSGDFEFSYLSLHFSFRGADEFQSKCMARCQLNNLEMIASLNGTYNSQLAKEIGKFRNKTSTQELIEAIESSLPGFCDGRNNRTVDGLPLSRGACKKNLTEYLSYLKESDLLPKSCNQLSKNLNSKSLYNKCDDDLQYKQRNKYHEIAHHVFYVIFPKVGHDGIVSFLRRTIGEDGVVSKKEGRFLTRFFQLFTTMKASEEILEMESTDDVIISGDFNLEVEDNSDHYRYRLWQHVLQPVTGAELFIDQPTTINFKQQLSRNYDHFIYSPGLTPQCDPNSASIFNFFTDALSSDYPLQAVIKRDPHPFVMSDHFPISINCSTTR